MNEEVSQLTDSDDDGTVRRRVAATRHQHARHPQAQEQRYLYYPRSGADYAKELAQDQGMSVVAIEAVRVIDGPFAR